MTTNNAQKEKDMTAIQVSESNSPENDGITHINISTKAATRLGRMLAHFYFQPFVHSVYGPFNCMEGLWHWLKSKERPDALRSMNGAAAKNYSKELELVKVDNFQQIIIDANYEKIMANPELKKLVLESTLPFDQYWVHGPDKVKIHSKGYVWIVAGFESIRQRIISEELDRHL